MKGNVRDASALHKVIVELFVDEENRILTQTNLHGMLLVNHFSRRTAAIKSRYGCV